MASADTIVKIGSRKSQLAMIQTESVIAKLKQIEPAATYSILTMETIGDHIQDVALAKIGERSLFTKELESALSDGRVDMLVHSMKDLPSTLPPGMAIGAVCERDDPHDALVLHPKHAGKHTLESLPAGSVLGTSSVRRVAQLKRRYPHLVFKDIRGNLNTRLRKLDDADVYDGIILAVAGMDRMGWNDRISQVLTPDVSLYAVSQGALAVEVKSDDHKLINLISRLNHAETLLRCVAERALLRKLDGGCSAPMGTHSVLDEENKLTITGAVLSLDGSECLKETQSVCLGTPLTHVSEDSNDTPNYRLYSSVSAPNISQNALQVAEDLGISVATQLHEMGAVEILNKAKEETAAKEVNK